MISREHVLRAFQFEKVFDTSPLYRRLCRATVEDDFLLGLAGQAQSGQVPTFLLFGAVHQLLLAGVEHPLMRFYPSVAGDSALPPDDAGEDFVAFCVEHEEQIADTVRGRLVQTNHVQRALGLRLGLSIIAAEIGEPVHLIEVGASAGFSLHFDRYGYRVGRRFFGDVCSPVQIVAEHIGTTPLPDLDALPIIASRQGIDLNPVDVSDPAARDWLEALVWPENGDQRALLSAALDVAAQDPPTIHRGDVIDLMPSVTSELPADAPRVVFHSATRIHVPSDRRAAFDAAIMSAGDTGPLWHLSIDGVPDPQPDDPTRIGGCLELQRSDTITETIAIVDGHLRWVKI